MKTIMTAVLATLVVASGAVGASAGQELRDGVRTGAIIHPHGMFGAYDQGHEQGR